MRGADFIQTQCIYNMPRFRDFMKKAVDMGLTEKAYILAGVTPMKSARMAQYMAKMVPGMDVPEELIKRSARTQAKANKPRKASSLPSSRLKSSRRWTVSPVFT